MRHISQLVLGGKIQQNFAYASCSLYLVEFYLYVGEKWLSKYVSSHGLKFLCGKDNPSNIQ